MAIHLESDLQVQQVRTLFSNVPNFVINSTTLDQEAQSLQRKDPQITITIIIKYPSAKRDYFWQLGIYMNLQTLLSPPHLTHFIEIQQKQEPMRRDVERESYLSTDARTSSIGAVLEDFKHTSTAIATKLENFSRITTNKCELGAI